MSFHKKPIPTTAKRVCPVCGTASYSATGVHPQCSQTKNSPKPPKKEVSTKTSSWRPTPRVT
jgi:hypothetical protein